MYHIINALNVVYNFAYPVALIRFNWISHFSFQFIYADKQSPGTGKIAKTICSADFFGIADGRTVFFVGLFRSFRFIAR